MDSGAVDSAKREQRGAARRALAATSSEERARWSAAVRDAIAAWDVFRSARTVMLYAPMGREVDVWPLVAGGLSAGARVALPRVDWSGGAMAPALVTSADASALAAGERGIREVEASAPAVAPEEVDLVLAPGLAFDRAGGRLGRAGGFYDRFLSGAWARGGGSAVGVCFAVQVVGRVATAAHDVPVGWLATEHGVERCGGGGGSADQSGSAQSG